MAETKETAAKHFNQKAATYHNEHYGKIDEKYPIFYLRHKYILNMIDGYKGTALDVGCGSGAMLIDLTKRGYKTIGVDISPKMLKEARKVTSKLGDHTPSLIVADIENLPFTNESFDLIICAGVIEYLTQDNKALSEISRVLKSNGTAFITVTNALTPFWTMETIAKITGIWPKLVSLAKREDSYPKARVHAPFHLKWLAAKIGLKEVDRAYFDFSPFPFPIGANLPNLRKKIGLKMEKLSKKPLGIIGRGCIIKFVKNAKIKV